MGILKMLLGVWVAGVVMLLINTSEFHTMLVQSINFDLKWLKVSISLLGSNVMHVIIILSINFTVIQSMAAQ